MDKIEQKILEIIDKNAEKIIAFGDDIWHHAELGYYEFRTSKKFSEQLESLGLECEKEIAITGVKSYLKEHKEGDVQIALMGEFDALPFPEYKDANPETGAAHLCGHNAQITGVIGAAMALCDTEVKEALDGNVVFMGVPNEEGSTAVELKSKLIEEGKVRYIGGKQEFVRLGVMDDIDLTVGHHVLGDPSVDPKSYVAVNGTSMGHMDKAIHFTGVSQHPAWSFKAVDALSGARLAMSAIDIQREAINKYHYWNTNILHGFIRSGGTATNVVSNDVMMDYNLRAKTLNDMLDMSYRVDRAVKGAAIATGTGVEIKTTPGYLPAQPLDDVSIVSEVFDIIDPEKKHNRIVKPKDDVGTTTDFADLSNLMPVIQFNTNGNVGVCHTLEFAVDDPYEYYVVPAKCFALLAYRLLKNGAEKAKEIIANNKPLLTKEEYFEILESMNKTETVEMDPVPNPYAR